MVFSLSVLQQSCSYSESLFRELVFASHGKTYIGKEAACILSKHFKKAQINAMKLSMNKDYLIFMHITLFNEVIRKFSSPQCSQYVIVALTRGGMVHTNKLLWEFLIYKNEWLRNKEENIARQKEQATLEKLKKCKNPQACKLMKE